MSKRIVNFEDGPNGAPPPGPQTMEDLLNSAQTAWRAGEKQKAFVTVLGAMAMMSAGIAQAMKMADAAMAEVQVLKTRLPKE